MNFGTHISISGGIDKVFERAKEVGANSIQIFTKNASRWKSKPLNPDLVLKYKNKCNLFNPYIVVAHDSYLINLCSPDKEKELKSVKALLDELDRCSLLEIPFLVIHPGSHLGKGEKWGINQIAQNLNSILHEYSGKTQILLETTAGQGSNIGYRFEHLSAIMEQITCSDKIGICIDTCHIFAAGYDFSTEETYNKTFDKANKCFGINKIKLFHLNDSKKELGSRVDRHENIGEGKIGLTGFDLLVNDSKFKNIPMILETPKGKTNELDIKNLNLLRNLRKE